MKAILKEALENIDCDYADIRVEEVERTAIAFRGRDLEDVSRNLELGGCLRVFKNGNWGVASFNKVEGTLNDLAKDAAAELELLPRKDEKLSFLGPISDEITARPDLDPRRVSLEQKHALVQGYNNILLKEPKITTTNAAYADAFIRSYFYSSENRYIQQDRVYTGVALSAVARDGTNVQSFGKSFGKTEGFLTLFGLEPDIEEIAKTTLGLLSAEPVAAGSYTVIVDPLLSGVFAHEAFGHLSESDFMYQNEPVLELMKIGTRYGIDELSIVDNGALKNERGYIAYDDEGVPSRETYLLRDGKISRHLHSRQTAAKMAEELTGNCRAISYRYAPIVRMTNTYIEPRHTSLEQMLGDVKSGLYVVGARGGMTELESFTFSSQYAWLIENGRKTRMIRDVVLAGNIFETLKNIEAIGDDLVIHGGLGGCGKAGQSPLPTGTGGPHVRIRNVIIGGK